MQEQAVGQRASAVARVSNLLGVLRPLCLGIVAACIAKAAVALHDGSEGHLLGPNTVIAVGGALPLLCSLAVSCGQALWIDVTGKGVRVRRLFAADRACAPDSLVFWGFKRELGTWSTLPPRPERARRARFRIETVDGFAVEGTVATRDAPRLASLMQSCLRDTQLAV
jgi:hypothetical protein